MGTGYKNEQQAPAVLIAGASPDTGNLGVSALCFSTLAGVARRIRGVRVTVLDHGRGPRCSTLPVDGEAVAYERRKVTASRLFYKRESLWNIRVAGWLGGLGGLANPNVRLFSERAAVLDVSGGDSFADLYGMRRFRQVAMTKIIALELGVPLVLLPQTYGPFKSVEAQRAARKIVRQSSMAWARDERSFQTLKELLGEHFDPKIHRCGVDVAFGLDCIAPSGAERDQFEAWRGRQKGAPILGFNVSGLVYLNPERARTDFEMRADYNAAVIGFLKRVLKETDASVAFVPHVIATRGYESDPNACMDVAKQLGAGDRVLVIPGIDDPCQMKWFISQCDWFCGTRMHATIAGLSSGVPTSAIAYSVKTQGVFETCGQGEHVVDPRNLGTDEVIEALWRSWNAREAARKSLAEHLPGVAARASEQMDVIAGVCAGGVVASERGAK